MEAYDYYLRAEQAARTGFRPQLQAALQLYEKAFTLDPAFAEAFAADAWTAAYVMRNDYDTVLPAPVARKRAYEHASKALSINPQAPLPFSVLAILQVVDHQHEEALASAERAVAFGPSDPDAYMALGLVLTFMGRYDDAVAAIETAARLTQTFRSGTASLPGSPSSRWPPRRRRSTSWARGAAAPMSKTDQCWQRPMPRRANRRRPPGRR